MKCEFCENWFENTRIKEYQNWQISLYLNQYYLGRCLIKLKDHKVDLTELSSEERDELFEKVLPELKNAVDELFNPRPLQPRHTRKRLQTLPPAKQDIIAEISGN
jgi:diadenosine tetraphosphate (Ap4A) HIT family hydrolase